MKKKELEILIGLLNNFMTADELREDENVEFLGYEEVLEMAYENLLGVADRVVKLYREIYK